MRSIAGGRSGSTATWTLFAAAAGSSALLIAHNPTTRLAVPLTGAVVLLGAIAAAHRALLAWRTMLGTIIVVLLFVPIKRYQLPSALPFNVELYRLVLFAAAILWFTALLADRRVRLRAGVLDPALATISFVYLASIVACGSRLDQPGLGSAAVKAFTLFLSMLVLYYMISSLTRTLDDVDALLRILVGAGAVVAMFTIVEARTQFNIFDHLDRILPFLVHTSSLTKADIARGGHLRAFASAEHPIALSALLVMLTPLAAYLGERTRRRRWWLATALLLAAALSTLSRTGVVMLVAVLVVYIWLRPQELRDLVRLGWKFAIPLAVVIHFLVPGTLGTIQDLFFGQGGVIAQQSGGSVGSGRSASFWPGVHVVGRHLIFGLGYGTRITGNDPRANSFIVDDGWLSTAMGAGMAAFFAWLWLFCRFVRRAGLEARKDRGDRGRLLAAMAGSVAAFAVGMATYDAFSFIQVSFVLYIVLALGTVTLRATRTAPGQGQRYGLPDVAAELANAQRQRA